MKTLILPANSTEAVSRAVAVLQAGQLVAFPTDTVYGIGAIAFDGEAVQSIYVAKGRPPEKAIPILLGDSIFLNQVTSSVPIMARRLAAHFCPGPLTLVVPKNLDLPDAVSETSTVGVRVPDHRFARELLLAVGPMAVTSANASGHPNTVTAQEVSNQLNGRIALILDGGSTPGAISSTVVDCTQKEPLILRIGPVSLHDIEIALR